MNKNSKIDLPEEDPRYPFALLQTAFEIKERNSKQFQEILHSIVHQADLKQEDFQNYLEKYRDDLRKSCKKKGLA